MSKDKVAAMRAQKHRAASPLLLVTRYLRRNLAVAPLASSEKLNLILRARFKRCTLVYPSASLLCSTFMSYLSSNKLRAALFVLGILGAIFAPPWIPLIVMGLLALRFRAPEVLVIGVFVDFMWLPFGSINVAIPLFTLAAIVLVWSLEPLRSQFLFAAKKN